MEYEEWRVQLRSVCGRYSPEGVEPKNFVGAIRPSSVWGCAAVDATCNVDRVERTSRDIRLDGMEHFYAVLQLGGRTTMIQNDRVAELAFGDVALVDATRPVTYISENRLVRSLSLQRICNVIRDRFTDPMFGPCQVATEVGISLRYLQKLFTVRNSSCTRFIYSVRLDHAARLLHRRALLNTGQPISQIAYASGFNDHTHFARQFRRRFGHPPGAHGKIGYRAGRPV